MQPGWPAEHEPTILALETPKSPRRRCSRSVMKTFWVFKSRCRTWPETGQQTPADPVRGARRQDDQAVIRRRRPGLA